MTDDAVWGKTPVYSQGRLKSGPSKVMRGALGTLIPFWDEDPFLVKLLHCVKFYYSQSYLNVRSIPQLATKRRIIILNPKSERSFLPGFYGHEFGPPQTGGPWARASYALRVEMALPISPVSLIKDKNNKKNLRAIP